MKAIFFLPLNFFKNKPERRFISTFLRPIEVGFRRITYHKTQPFSLDYTALRFENPIELSFPILCIDTIRTNNRMTVRTQGIVHSRNTIV
jgi:hypothetical protein